MVTNKHNVVVVMVALPLHGHINQLLHLSRLISAHNLPVHFVCTTVHGRQAALRLQGWNPSTIPTLIFHHFPISPLITQSLSPNHYKFPSHFHPLCEATATQLRGPVASLLNKLSPTTNRLVIIHDSLVGSVVQDFVSLPNAESYTFHSVSAFSIALYTLSEDAKQQILNAVNIEPRGITRVEGCFSSEFKKFIAVQHEFAKLSSGRIYNTCRVVEEEILEMLEAEARNRNELLCALGPFNPVNIHSYVSTQGSKIIRYDGGNVAQCLNWLDKQASKSVIFVSFGTTTSLTEEQIKEIAIGLENSEQNFMWVVRDADRGDLSNDDTTYGQLPEGYEDHVKDQGVVIREWAPQLDILAHPSVGGFMSHCGWNSCIESMSMGVPIVAWPMHSDQPNNAMLLTRILKVGIQVKDWCQIEQVVLATDVEKSVRRLMASKEGDEIRKRAVAIGRQLRKSVKDDGVGQKELQSFIAHISR